MQQTRNSQNILMVSTTLKMLGLVMHTNQHILASSLSTKLMIIPTVQLLGSFNFFNSVSGIFSELPKSANSNFPHFMSYRILCVNSTFYYSNEIFYHHEFLCREWFCPHHRGMLLRPGYETLLLIKRIGWQLHWEELSVLFCTGRCGRCNVCRHQREKCPGFSSEEQKVRFQPGLPCSGYSCRRYKRDKCTSYGRSCNQRVRSD
jgi:hypothetical protein